MSVVIATMKPPESAWTRLAWYVPTAALLVLLPVLKYSELWWKLPRDQKLALVIAVGAFGAACLVTLVFERDRNWKAAGRALILGLAVLGIFLLGLLMIGHDAPRYLLLALFAAVAVVIPLSVSPIGGSWLPATTLGIAMLAVGGVAIAHLNAKSTAAQVTKASYLRSAFYTVQATSHEGLIPAPATRGGGLDRVGDQVLLGTGDGYLYLMSVPPGDAAPHVEKLDTRVPHNRDEFAAAFGGSSRAPARSSEYSEAGPPKVQTWRFRVADVIAKTEGDRVRLFASHHFWKADEQCFVVRVSTLEASLADLAASIRHAQWHTLYESTPCIALTGPQRKRGKNPFKGEEVGGRLALLDGSTLLLTLGDQGFSGIESLQAFSQDPATSYGKTIRIDMTSGVSSPFTLGHRNPQGLYVTPDGTIWESEHGAQGGDELNALEAGTNYGWPIVTYGTDYGSTLWPVSRTQGHHENFREPRYSWVPSIGASQVIRIERDSQFPIWQGNLLLGSLSTRSLYRLVLDDTRVVLAEPISLGKRVRDILELNDGRLLVWTDDAALVVLEPAKGNDAESLFASQCSGCHSIEDGMSHRLGPDLYQVGRRDVASASGFDEYSAALKAQDGKWTRERLDAFIKNPQGAVPGTSMGFAGIEDERQRAALIEYLERSAAKK